MLTLKFETWKLLHKQAPFENKNGCVFCINFISCMKGLRKGRRPPEYIKPDASHIATNWTANLYCLVNFWNILFLGIWNSH